MDAGMDCRCLNDDGVCQHTVVAKNERPTPPFRKVGL